MENITIPKWARELDCAITVCDCQGVILYQNERSHEVNGPMEGQSMLPCHNERSRGIIDRLIREGGKNVYTISKKSLRKLIYQTVWRKEGVIGGLVEFSLEIPEQMPHYIRS